MRVDRSGCLLMCSFWVLVEKSVSVEDMRHLLHGPAGWRAACVPSVYSVTRHVGSPSELYRVKAGFLAQELQALDGADWFPVRPEEARFTHSSCLDRHHSFSALVSIHAANFSI